MTAGGTRSRFAGWAEQADDLAFLRAVGFRELTRTERGWTAAPTR